MPNSGVLGSDDRHCHQGRPKSTYGLTGFRSEIKTKD